MASKYEVTGSGAAIPGTTDLISGKPRATFRYKATFGDDTLTQITVTKGASEDDGAWAGHVRELADLVAAINVCRDGTAHAALKTRIEAID